MSLIKAAAHLLQDRMIFLLVEPVQGLIRIVYSRTCSEPGIAGQRERLFKFHFGATACRVALTALIQSMSLFLPAISASWIRKPD